MNLPRFNAEAALYRSIGPYHASVVGPRVAGGVNPARFLLPCSKCADICAGGTSICYRWCACVCRGGTHCGVPD